MQSFLQNETATVLRMINMCEQVDSIFFPQRLLSRGSAQGDFTNSNAKAHASWVKDDIATL